MKRIMILLIILSQHVASFGQQKLTIEAHGAYNSTALPIQIPNAFLYGGFLDSSLLNATYLSLGPRLTFGLQMNAAAQYQSNKAFSKDSLKPLANWNWQFGANVTNFTGLQLSKDAFGLAFLGGSPFIGDTLDFSATRLQSCTFSSYGIGLYQAQTQTAFQLNLVAMHQCADLQVGSSSWYQDFVSDSIYFNSKAQAYFSNQPLTGVGLSLDLDYRFSSETDNEPLEFQLKIQNLGMSYQYQALTRYQLNGTYNYGAYDLAGLQQFNISEQIAAAKEQLGYSKDAIRNWYLLPATIRLSKLINEDSLIKFQAYYGAQFMLRKTYTPCFFAGIHWSASKIWQTGVGVVYGGFGGLRAQAYSTFAFDKVKVSFRSDNVAFQKGGSIYMQLQCDLH
jgi:hypothetical protein